MASMGWPSGVFLSTSIELVTEDSSSHPDIASGLQAYPDVFTEQKGLPPSYSQDHRIPLILGAALTNIRP